MQLSKQYTRYYADHPDELRTCKQCKHEDLLKEFVANYFFRNVCKRCHRLRISSWRDIRPELNKAAKKRSFKKSAQFIASFKLNRPCARCGIVYPPCAMDFNHLDRTCKNRNVAQLYEKSRRRIMDEITRCELICANCHRNYTQEHLHEIPTRKNRIFRPAVKDVDMKPGDPSKVCARCTFEKHVNNFTLLKNGRRHSYCKKCLRAYNGSFKRHGTQSISENLIRSLKDNKPCTDCGRTFRYWSMDFDHVQQDKIHDINKFRRLNLEGTLAELKKCELVCANCHRMRTHRRKLKESGGQCPCVVFAPEHALPSVSLLVTKFLRTMGCDVELEHPVGNMHYDVAIPDSKLLIECYRLDVRKYENAILHGYSFIGMFEDEWMDRPDAFKAIISNKLGLGTRPISIRPGKCRIDKILTKEADEFYEKYHYIGSCKAPINYGAFHQDRLIACASFKHPTRQSKHDLELVRMTSHPGFRVHGIWSKILKRFINEYSGRTSRTGQSFSLVSFSDNRIFAGGVYKKIGFQYDGEVSPDYYWVKDRQRFHKSGLRKKSYEKNSGLTEYQLREAQGYHRVYDLGKKRWVLKIPLTVDNEMRSRWPR